MNLFVTNQNKSERILRFIISLFLLPATYFFGNSIYSLILSVIGGILLFNAIVGTCFTYRLFSINTCKID